MHVTSTLLGYDAVFKNDHRPGWVPRIFDTGERTTTMRLSKAIRLGAMLHPQGFHAYKRAVKGVIVATCALGAAAEAGYQVHDTKGTASRTMASRTVLQPELLRHFACPVCGTEGSAFSIVVELNDRHRWTRERIADWVESCETPVMAVEPALVEVKCG